MHRNLVAVSVRSAPYRRQPVTLRCLGLCGCFYGRLRGAICYTNFQLKCKHTRIHTKYAPSHIIYHFLLGARFLANNPFNSTQSNGLCLTVWIPVCMRENLFHFYWNFLLCIPIPFLVHPFSRSMHTCVLACDRDEHWEYESAWMWKTIRKWLCVVLSWTQTDLFIECFPTYCLSLQNGMFTQCFRILQISFWEFFFFLDFSSSYFLWLVRFQMAIMSDNFAI